MLRPDGAQGDAVNTVRPVRFLLDRSLQIVCGLLLAVPLLATLPGTGHAAPLLFDQNVTPDVIFGSGNSNGSFTVDRTDGVELGLRAKIPFVGTTNSNGDGTYSYSLAEADPRWNFDWTINTDYDDSTGFKIDDLTYELGMDFDPSQGTNFLAFDPVTQLLATTFYDHSIGTNATANGGGAEAGDAATYAGLIANNTVLQQSWRYAFFSGAEPEPYDPSIDGTYDVYLKAFAADGSEVASTSIQVIIGAGGGAAPVPEPTGALLFGVGMAVVALRGRRSGLQRASAAA